MSTLGSHISKGSVWIPSRTLELETWIISDSHKYVIIHARFAEVHFFISRPNLGFLVEIVSKTNSFMFVYNVSIFVSKQLNFMGLS